jgi:hypothetical protein
VRESAVRDKPPLVYGLARNRRSPKCPPEPRPSGVHPEEDEVGKDGIAILMPSPRRHQGSLGKQAERDAAKDGRNGTARGCFKLQWETVQDWLII